MIQRPNPLNVVTLGRLGGSTFKEDLDKLHDQIVSASQTRNGWVTKQEKLLRQRKGVRKAKVFPWPGANNHNWPLTDGIIRRWKPGMIALITGSDPVAYFFAQNPNAVRLAPIAQAFYHWQFHEIDAMRETSMELTDYVAQYGTAYTRQGWDYRVRKSCRILNVASLFPQGVDAAVQAHNAQAQQVQMQFQQAVQQGQADPNEAGKLPQMTNALELVQQTVENEYVMSAESPLEHQQVIETVKAILGGAQQVRLYYDIITADRPGWRALNPLDVIVPPHMVSMEDADYIAVNWRLTADEILKRAKDGDFDMVSAGEVVSKLEGKQQTDTESNTWEEHSYYSGITRVKDVADGLDTTEVLEDHKTNIWEIYTKMDLDGDRLKEKVVIWYHPDSRAVLAAYPYPFPFEEWPIVRFQFEHLSPRPYESRGVAELTSVFQAQVNKMHNARLDAVQITLAPMFQMKVTAGEVNRNIKFLPGGIIPVQQVGDIAPLAVDTHSIIQLMQEENLTKAQAEQMIGLFDPSVLAENSSDRRTATEVDAVTSQMQSVMGQDASMFQESMRKVHKQLWALIQEFSKEDLVYRVEGEEIPRLAKKSEISCQYDLVPAGTPANTSKQLAMSRVREMLQLLGPDQTGLVNKTELYKAYLDVLDHNMSKLVLRSPDQAAAVQMLMQAANKVADQQGIPPNQRPATP